MHAGLKVNAHLLSLPACLSQHCAPLFPQPNGCPIEDGVFGIVLQAVADYQVEVLLKLIQVQVAIGLQLLLHCVEVHRFLDVVQVVWDLQWTKSREAKRLGSHFWGSPAPRKEKVRAALKTALKLLPNLEQCPHVEGVLPFPVGTQDTTQQAVKKHTQEQGIPSLLKNYLQKKSLKKKTLKGLLAFQGIMQQVREK